MLDAEPPFAYTIGLTRFQGHPEIITFGLCVDHLGDTLNVLGEAVRVGIDVRSPAFLDELFQPDTTRMITVEDSSRHLLGANRVYRAAGQPPVPALQLIWADGEGLFPWNFGFAEGGWPQPLLGKAARASVDMHTVRRHHDFCDNAAARPAVHAGRSRDGSR
ncbi:MAG: DUF4262 domain-containing protein [Actinopolymorphaceae bacterium]